MNKSAVTAAVIILLALIIGCAEDIYLDEQAPIVGSYKGEYVVTEYEGGSTVEYRQPIDWMFTEDNKYIMHFDYAKLYTVTNFQNMMCRVDGKYSLDEGVVLVKKHSQPDVSTSCNDGNDPEGVFTLFRKSGGRLELHQLGFSYDSLTQILKQVLLRPAMELEKSYYGFYIFTAGETEKTQTILWTFTDDKCYLDVDPSGVHGLFNEEWPVCRSFGAYSKSGGTVTIDNEWSRIDEEAGFDSCALGESLIDGAFTAIKGDTIVQGLSAEQLLTVDLTRTSGDTIWNIFLIELPTSQ